ncbi:MULTISPECIES: nitroreductase family protein [unclassified Microbacterium]|uniref:nitroreductase family protein n=1 Tax=unclassified Microbacterium TaxID=2609290 RepID=UPI00214BF415|nr:MULTISPECIES: nitroreductase family protein [unclassified Microbacterium]MCR2808449.1 nitroreductase family protein [Microbacterium sp. zg.B185]WIM19107.1 nitroreductase family protein [Microbacterium sp. zg-B185]
MTATLSRSADTDAPVLDVLSARWSPRAFAVDAPIDESKLASALEAARWAPSANNSQPWRFIVARRGSSAHDAIHDSLLGFNQAWADKAAVLIVAVAETADTSGKATPFAAYDLGQAVAHLSVQAHHDGLHVHQMGGFDVDALRARFDLGENLRPVTVIALGVLGDAADLPEALQERESAPRVRRALSDSILLDA